MREILRAFRRSPKPRIGVAFLARGFHENWKHAFARFVASYQSFPAGIPHRLYVIYKGYRDAQHLAEGQTCFSVLTHVPIQTDDGGFDIGCYQRVAREMSEEFVCFLNTKSEILSPDWLLKLAAHLDRPSVGLVGNSGSYESIRFKIPTIPGFPNPHIRTNAFLMRRALFSQIADSFTIRTKDDGWRFECGADGLSRQLLRRGLEILVVGRNGEPYGVSHWPVSKTYRSVNATPLIGDDAFRAFREADCIARRDMAAITWGPPAEEARVRAGLAYQGEQETVESPVPKEIAA